MRHLLFLFLFLKFFSWASEPKTALVFGVSGQDGIYLSEFLLGKGYEVHGTRRVGSEKNKNELLTLEANGRLYVHEGDLREENFVCELISRIMPDEIYNLAAESHIALSFDHPLFTAEVNALGPVYILETIRKLKNKKNIKFYQASTSEMFGKVSEVPEVETTPFYPRSPYGISKLFAHWTTVNYREAFGVFACNGILCNHESPLREETFVTRKIILGACRYKYGLQDILYLGNLDARRDWGYAKDYVEAMWLMLQHDIPDDYVIATGKSHSVREFTELAYKELGINIEWHGQGKDEYGIDKNTGQMIVKVNPKFYRPLEVEYTLGNGKKAKEVLNWEPKTTFMDLLKIMIQAEVARIEKLR